MQRKCDSPIRLSRLAALRLSSLLRAALVNWQFSWPQMLLIKFDVYPSTWKWFYQASALIMSDRKHWAINLNGLLMLPFMRDKRKPRARLFFIKRDFFSEIYSNAEAIFNFASYISYTHRNSPFTQAPALYFKSDADLNELWVHFSCYGNKLIHPTPGRCVANCVCNWAENCNKF